MTTGVVRCWTWTRAATGGLLGLSLLLTGCRGGASEPIPPKTSRRSIEDVLERAGDVHQAALAAGETVTYPIELNSGEALLIEVEQAEVDIAVEIVAPGGELLLAFDTPTHRSAPERICVVTETTGAHALHVAPFSGAGGYTVHLIRRRVATDRDRLCFAASGIFQAATARDLLGRIAAYEQAAELWERADELFLAALAWRESASSRRDIGPATRSIERFERALELAREAGSSYLEVSVLNRLGLSLIDLGDLASARLHLAQAESRARETGDDWGYASALTNLGFLADLEGDPHRAIDRYSAALPRWRQVGDPIEVAQTLQNMATAYGVLDRHDRALDLLTEALALTRQAGDEGREANVLAALGWIHYLRGRPADGLPALERVLEIRRRQGNVNGEAAALDRMGTLLLNAGFEREAERAYRQSLALSNDSASPFDAAATVANLGCLYAETGRLDEARVQLEDALRRYEGFDDPRAVSHVEYCLARATAAAGETVAALGHVGRALGIVGQLRESARSRGHYYRPIWLWQDYAELEIELLFRRHREAQDEAVLERAFEAADLARARTLFEQVVENRIGVRSAAGDSLVRTERRLQSELNHLARARADNDAASASDEQSLDTEIRRLRSELERARAAIRAADPRHQATSPRPVTVEVARQLLAPRTALLSYVLGEESSHLLLLDATRLTAHQLPPRRELETYAKAFHQALQESRRNHVQWRLIAERLSDRLLPQDAIPLDVDRLIIVPDGLLHYVPFAALTSPHHDDQLVIDDFEVTYVPSVSVLARLRERSHHRGSSRIAVFADPVYAPENRGGLPRLPFSAQEARSIAALAGPQGSVVKLGFEASKDAVLEADLQAYGILHFATHALIDEGFPELSGLVLSQLDRAGVQVDPELRLHEIHGLEIDAALTVLSGCQTALGDHVRGNGLEGFAHGFLYAGSDRVLVSLWKVYDQSTARLMAEFYRNLLQGGASPTSALHQAQNWLRQQPQWEAPVYWASFVLQGLD